MDVFRVAAHFDLVPIQLKHQFMGGIVHLECSKDGLIPIGSDFQVGWLLIACCFEGNFAFALYFIIYKLANKYFLLGQCQSPLPSNDILNYLPNIQIATAFIDCVGMGLWGNCDRVYLGRSGEGKELVVELLLGLRGEE